jgi:ammonia channel protein AmtB
MSPNEILLFCLSISIVTGLTFVFLGYQIAFKEKQHWINGVDFSKLSSPIEFTKAMGRSLINTGVVFFIVSLLLYVQVVGYLTFALILTVISFYPVLVFVQAKKKYS